MPKADTIRLRVTTEEKVRFEKEAKLADLSLSEWLRRLANLNCASFVKDIGAVPVMVAPRTKAQRKALDKNWKTITHDTKSCRLYGCLMCKARGVKNAKRGL